LLGKTEIDNNQWHLATAIYDPTGKTVHIRLFVDDKLDAEYRLPEPLHQTDDPVWIGANSEQPEVELPGMIDEVAILSRAMSAEEVAALFAAGNPARKMGRDNKQ
jgi:hypothetical protein